MVSPYKDYSSVFRWQANLCVPLWNYGFASMKVWCDFGVLAFFLVYEIIWLFAAFIELLGLVDAFFVVYVIISLLVVSCKTLSGYENTNDPFRGMK
jgi:hypothetical protein